MLAAAPPRRACPTRPAILALAVAIAITLAAGLPGSGSVAPAVASTLPTGVTPVSGSVTFHGKGYGHGVGLSQYGARGRALAGQTASTIIAHYYRNTTLGTISATTPVRVLLLLRWAATRTAPLVIHGRGGGWTVEGVAGTLPADARLTLSPVATATSTGTTWSWRLTINAADGRVLHDSTRTLGFRIRSAATATRLELGPKPATRNLYRGTFRVLPRADAAQVSVINELGLDAYLGGVVPAEMPSGWPTEALRAQAIVARSYAARALRPGVGSWDVYDDTRSQVYHGALGERATTNAAIAATAGRVVMSGTAIANTVFHSTAGGHTEHNENVFVSSSGAKVAAPVAYLRGVPDTAPDGTAWDAAAPYHRWSSSPWTVSQLSSWLAADSRTAVGTLLGLDLRDRGVSGRLISVTIHGTTATKRVSAAVFRSVINARRPSGSLPIRSDLFALAPLP